MRKFKYVRVLGLAAGDAPVRMANPIYAELIPRELAHPLEETLAGSVDPRRCVNDDQSLDITGLLEAFQSYFREHAESWVERFGHKEAGPQLVLPRTCSGWSTATVASRASTLWAASGRTC